MKSKYLKIVVGVLVIGLTLFSGISFSFPKEWGWNFVVNGGVMSKTFLMLASGIAILKVSNSFDIYVKNRGGK